LSSRLATVAILLAALGTACGGSTPSPPPPVVPPAVATVSVTMASANLVVGQTSAATAVLRDASSNALTGRTITWSSSALGVATVSTSGMVTAVAAGAANIMATSEGQSGFATATVTTSVPVATVTVSLGSTRRSIGQTTEATATIRDASGTRLTGRVVSWNTSNALVAAVNASGIVTAVGPGTSSITATSENVQSAGAILTAAVPGAPVSMVATTAIAQTGAPGLAVIQAPGLVVEDAAGYAVSGVSVSFAVTAGGGAIGGVSGTTDVDGVARLTSWLLGAPGSQAVRATTPSIPSATVDFAALARAPEDGFDISMRLLTPMSDFQARAFVHAKERIQEIITGDLPLQTVIASAAQCGASVNQVVDDVLILAEVVPIDGVGQILGRAGPCILRDGSLLPALGHMMFDTADLDRMESNGTLENVILHEMLHVVGYGTLWDLSGQLADPGTLNPFFLGPKARANFATYNGGALYSGIPVPVEETGGAGTRDSHWRESVFNHELMTGWIDLGAIPLSATTVGSLQDLGYTVDVSKADPFDLSTAIRASALSIAEPPIFLEGDVRTEPPIVVGLDGRPVAR